MHSYHVFMTFYFDDATSNKCEAMSLCISSIQPIKGPFRKCVNGALTKTDLENLLLPGGRSHRGSPEFPPSLITGPQPSIEGPYARSTTWLRSEIGNEGVMVVER